jgi:hypothetical protein
MGGFFQAAPQIVAGGGALYGAWRVGQVAGAYIDRASGGAVSGAIANTLNRVVGPPPQSWVNFADRVGLQNYNPMTSSVAQWIKP